MINRNVTVRDGGILHGGNGDSATGTLYIDADLTMHAGSAYKVVLGAGAESSSVVRTYGDWSFDPSLIVLIEDQGAELGFYMNIISGLSSPVDVSGWSIANSGYEGTFFYDNGGIHLDLTMVPEPATIAAIISAFALAGVALRRRQRTSRN